MAIPYIIAAVSHHFSIATLALPFGFILHSSDKHFRAVILRSKK